MGKKGNKRKTRWRVLPIGGDDGDCICSANEEDGDGERVSASPTTSTNGSCSYARSAYVQRGPGKLGKSRPGYQQPYYRQHTYSENKQPLVTTEKKTFNEEEYTKITTPRQDVLFKKGYLGRKRPNVSPNGHLPNATSTTDSPVLQNGGAADGEQLEMMSPTEEMPQILYNSSYPVDQGVYYINGSGYELYDPYIGNLTVVVGPAPHYAGAGSGPPVLAAVSCQPLPLQPLEWFNPTVLPFMSTTCPRDRRKRSSTDSQNCSPQSSESTDPPGSPQEGEETVVQNEVVEILDDCAVYQHHPQQPAYMYPGYMFGPPVYNVNGITVQGITPQPRSVDVSGSKRRKKKRRRRRRRGGVDDGSEESSSDDKELEEPASLTSQESSQELESDSKHSAGSRSCPTDSGKNDLSTAQLETTLNLATENTVSENSSNANVATEVTDALNVDSLNTDDNCPLTVTSEVTQCIRDEPVKCSISNDSARTELGSQTSVNTAQELSNLQGVSETGNPNNICTLSFTENVAVAVVQEKGNPENVSPPVNMQSSAGKTKKSSASTSGGTANRDGPASTSYGKDTSQTGSAKGNTRSKRASKAGKQKQKHQYHSTECSETHLTNNETHKAAPKTVENNVTASTAPSDCKLVADGNENHLGHTQTSNTFTIETVPDDVCNAQMSFVNAPTLSSANETVSNAVQNTLQTEDLVETDRDQMHQLGTSPKSGEADEHPQICVPVNQCTSALGDVELPNVRLVLATSEHLLSSVNEDNWNLYSKTDNVEKNEKSVKEEKINPECTECQIPVAVDAEVCDKKREVCKRHACSDTSISKELENSLPGVIVGNGEQHPNLIDSTNEPTPNLSRQNINNGDTEYSKELRKTVNCAMPTSPVHNEDIEPSLCTNNVESEVTPRGDASSRPVPPPRRKKYQPNSKLSAECPPPPRDVKSHALRSTVNTTPCRGESINELVVQVSVKEQTMEQISTKRSSSASFSRKMQRRTLHRHEDSNSEINVSGGSTSTSHEETFSEDNSLGETYKEVCTEEVTDNILHQCISNSSENKTEWDQLESASHHQIEHDSLSHSSKDIVDSRHRYSISLSTAEKYANTLAYKVVDEAVVTVAETAKSKASSPLPITEAVTRWLKSQYIDAVLSFPETEDSDRDCNGGLEDNESENADVAGTEKTGQKNVLRNPLPVPSRKSKYASDATGIRVASFNEIKNTAPNDDLTSEFQRKQDNSRFCDLNNNRFSSKKDNDPEVSKEYGQEGIPFENDKASIDISCENDTEEGNTVKNAEETSNNNEESNYSSDIETRTEEDFCENQSHDFDSFITDESVDENHLECDSVIFGTSLETEIALYGDNTSDTINFGSHNSRCIHMCDPSPSVSKYYRLVPPADKIDTLSQDEMEEFNLGCDREIDGKEHFDTDILTEIHATEIHDEVLSLKPLPESWAIDHIKLSQETEGLIYSSKGLFERTYGEYSIANTDGHFEKAHKENIRAINMNSLDPVSETARAFNRTSTILMTRISDGPFPCGGICCILQ